MQKRFYGVHKPGAADRASYHKLVGRRQRQEYRTQWAFAQYKKELDVIGAEATRLGETVQTTRSEISATFKQIQALRDQIVMKQKALSESINALSGATNP